MLVFIEHPVCAHLTDLSRPYPFSQQTYEVSIMFSICIWLISLIHLAFKKVKYLAQSHIDKSWWNLSSDLALYDSLSWGMLVISVEASDISVQLQYE